jgi:hypothetical protein
MAIGGTILLMVISGYFKLNYHRLLMAIGGIILLIAIGGYFIDGYWWIFY